MEFVTYEKNYTYNTDKSIKSIYDSKMDDMKNFEYDELGRLIKESIGAGEVRETVYDNAGHIVRMVIKNKAGAVTAEEISIYNEEGNLISVKRMNGVTFTHTYDSLNRIVLTTNTLGDEITYTYTDIGRDVVAVVNGNTTRQTQKKFINREGKEIYQSLTDDFTNGVIHTMEYNQYGELVKFANSSNFSYIKEYNAVGKETLYKSNFETIVYEYDEMNNLLSQTNSGTLLYEYTYQDNRLSTKRNVCSGESETYTYNADGLIEKIVSVEQKIEDPYAVEQ